MHARCSAARDRKGACLEAMLGNLDQIILMDTLYQLALPCLQHQAVRKGAPAVRALRNIENGNGANGLHTLKDESKNPELPSSCNKQIKCSV